jgi:hypothetical protein
MMENALWRILHLLFTGEQWFYLAQTRIVIPRKRSDEESESYDTGTTQHSDYPPIGRASLLVKLPLGRTAADSH